MLRAHRITGVAPYVTRAITPQRAQDKVLRQRAHHTMVGTGRARPSLSSQDPHLRTLPSKEVPSTTNLDCAHPRPRFPKPQCAFCISLFGNGWPDGKGLAPRCYFAWLCRNPFRAHGLHCGPASPSQSIEVLLASRSHTWGAPLRRWTNHSITPLEPRSELKAGRRWTHAHTPPVSS